MGSGGIAVVAESRHTSLWQSTSYCVCLSPWLSCLPIDIRLAPTLTTFKSSFKMFYVLNHVFMCLLLIIFNLNVKCIKYNAFSEILFYLIVFMWSTLSQSRV